MFGGQYTMGRWYEWISLPHGIKIWIFETKRGVTARQGKKRLFFFLQVDDKAIRKITQSDFFLIDAELQDENDHVRTRR